MQFKKFNTIDDKELKAANNVLRSGILSAFYASKNGFDGGKKIQEFEDKLRKKPLHKHHQTFITVFVH